MRGSGGGGRRRRKRKSRSGCGPSGAKAPGSRRGASNYTQRIQDACGPGRRNAAGHCCGKGYCVSFITSPSLCARSPASFTGVEQAASARLPLRRGGFLVDGGHSYGPGKDKMSFSPSSACGGVRPPSVTMRHEFPRDWKIILALPDIAAGAHGKREVDIFREYCPLPAAEVHELCYQILVLHGAVFGGREAWTSSERPLTECRR